MKPTLRSLVLLLVLLLPILAACSGTTPAPAPTEAPAADATEAPAEEPTEAPAADATEAPVEEPTEAPAEEPTEAPAEEPTEAPAADATTPPATGGGDATASIEGDIRVGLVTDIGRVNDGTFNQFAHEGAVRASDEFDLEYRYIETQNQADYASNLQTLLDENFNVIVTVGFLIADATFAAAEANPEVLFIGVDQSFTGERALPNLVGLQFREDEGGFLVGALAGMMTESDVVGFIGGIDIPPVKRYRSGYENAVQYVNPDATVLGTYIPSFTDPAAGASTANQFVGEGADVIFGAGGPTGSGGIRAAAEAGAFVIGVDQDEFVTTFGNGSTPGADRLLTSAIKRVDVGVYEMVRDIVEGEFQGNRDFILNVANGGIGYADFNQTADMIPDAAKARLEEIREMLADGSLNTGVDPVTGEIDAATVPAPVPFDPNAAPTSMEPTSAPAAGESTLRVGLVTDIGRVNDGTFNQFAHEGAVRAAEELGVEYRFIETQNQADYEANINTLLDENFNVIVTVGFLIADATYDAAQANPDITFIGVDQDFSGERALPNLIGIQFREDQAGFLVGTLAGMMTESDVVGFIGGIDIPPVKRFRNGYENGVAFVNPDATTLGTYIPSFTDPATGASVANQFLGEGADIIFGAGGPTGSGAIKAAAEQGAFVLGVDQDEYFTTFGGGSSPGSDRILSSALKRVDVGVYDQIVAVADGSFSGEGNYVLSVENGGIGYADFHETADAVPDAVAERLAEIEAALGDGSLTTGVDPATGDPDPATIPAAEPFTP